MARPILDDFVGDEYYVDASGGSNANAGTSDAAAWQTINYAISTGIPAAGYNSTDGVRLNIKSNADHTLTTALTSGGSLYSQLGVNYTSANRFIMQGYTSSANDGGVGKIVNNCGGSVRFIEDATSDYTTLADLHCETGTSSRLIMLDRNCYVTDCAFTEGATTSTGDVIYADIDTVFENCFFDLQGGIRFLQVHRNCIFLNSGTSPILEFDGMKAYNCLFIGYGTANKTYLTYGELYGCALVNIGSGTYTYGARVAGREEAGTSLNYFENVSTCIYSLYTKRTSGLITDNYSYNCTTNTIAYGTGTGPYPGRQEDVIAITASPFSSITTSGFTLSDGSELMNDFTIGTDNGDGWKGLIKRFAGTGGPISGGVSYTPAASAKFTRLE